MENQKDGEQNRLKPHLQQVESLKERESQLLMKLLPAKREEIAGLLARLSLHYSLGTATQSELKMLMDDYCDDLSNISFFALESACRMFRQDINNKFYPRAAELRELAIKAAVNTRAELSDIREKLHQLDTLMQLSKPELSDHETVSKIMDGLRANWKEQDLEKRQPVTFPDKNYFEKKTPRENHTAQESYESGGLLR